MGYRFAVGVLVVALLVGCAGGAPAPAGTGETCRALAPAPPETALQARVRRVVDGDTFVLADGTRVRLLGINAPESADPRRPVERYGLEASRFARSLLEGQPVLLQPGRNPQDRYGRLLAWVWLTDGRFVNAELVRLGYAQVSTYPDNPDHAAHLLACQREARAANSGLWRR